MHEQNTIDPGKLHTMAPPAGETPITTIEPTPGWRLINVGELWRYRELLFFLTWRDIKVRYKQTILGAIWAIIQPVMTMIVFTIFFGRLGKMDQFTDKAYPIFVFAALVPWLFFSQSVTRSGLSLISGANLITKVYFPRLIVPFASAGGLLVDLAISFVIMFLMMVWYRVPPTANLAMLPVLILATVLATLGVGTFLSALAVAYRDVRHAIPFVVRIGMFVSPVAYPIAAVQEKWPQAYYAYILNPMAGIISGFRSAMLGEPFYWDALGISFLVSLILFVVGAFYFRRIERRFADIV